jgi:hypothetical protein
MRQVWIQLVTAVAIAGCTSGTEVDRNQDVASMWRHEDGTAVSGTEYAEARTACERTGVRESQRYAGPASNPAYRPGGEGLMATPPGAGFLSPIESPNSTAVGQGAVPLGDCLRSKGFVRANTG